MASERYDRAHHEGTGLASRPPVTTKILIAGGFGAGKTTMVGSISEIRPLHTEEPLTDRGAGVDDLAGVGAKSTTTVAMDFGRITLSDQLLLYLFGTPGQERFWFMWDELAAGAIGAVVIADTRRLTGSFPAIDYFERRGVPFVVAVNCFDGLRTHRPEDIAIALDLDPDVPVVLCDVRRRESSKEVLVALMEHVLSWPDAGPDAGPDERGAAGGERTPDHREAAT
ncbi:GTP-binding protein [Actinomadura bangladeshensis]|uniref:ATP/GTP-binding protein n=1 Tax=Actinomadura bangladeshensis TaxID=453573 RepID=A0A6L9QPN4_9ACTN|nr:ATP/GTP-binding protein [Actinomadura bangladeshensis]NEA25914.1 ATP/GTP-binding protein [Actinomadura bangladeshensis]